MRLPSSLKVAWWPLDRLTVDGRNPRLHPPAQIRRIVRSIQEFGWTSPILADGGGLIIAGEARWDAAKQLQLDAVPVIVLDHLTRAQREAYRIADNRIPEGAGWDERLLAQVMAELQAEAFDLSVTGFDDEELARMVASLEPQVEPGQADDDEAGDEVPEPPREPVSRAGDLWCLGEHRLLCGDSTDGATVARLMGGERATLVFTSPPYGQQRDYTTGGIGDWDALMRGVFGALPVAEDAQVLVNLGLIHRDNEWVPYWQGWLDWMRAQGWRRFGLYVWDQGPGLPGDWNGRLAPSFEFVMHFNRVSRRPHKIVPCKWAGQDTHLRANGHSTAMRRADGSVGAWCHAGQTTQDFRIPDNVIRIGRHKARGIEVEHPAVFPVALPEFILQAYSDTGTVIYEPFSGSGSTLIAGQRTGRVVRAIDLAPAYVDVALRRWQQLFPDMPVLLDGRSFADVAAQRGATQSGFPLK